MNTLYTNPEQLLAAMKGGWTADFINPSTRAILAKMMPPDAITEEVISQLLTNNNTPTLLVRVYGPNGNGRIEKPKLAGTYSPAAATSLQPTPTAFSGITTAPHVVIAPPVQHKFGDFDGSANDNLYRARLEDLTKIRKELEEELHREKLLRRKLESENLELKTEVRTAELKTQLAIDRERLDMQPAPPGGLNGLVEKGLEALANPETVNSFANLVTAIRSTSGTANTTSGGTSYSPNATEMADLIEQMDGENQPIMMEVVRYLAVNHPALLNTYSLVQNIIGSKSMAPPAGDGQPNLFTSY